VKAIVSPNVQPRSPVKALLHVPELARRSRLHYAASVLSDSIALDPPLEIVEARDADFRGLLLPNGVVVPEEELQAVFSTITLGRELETGKLDPMGRFDESAIAWDISRPWIDVRAADLAARLTEDGCGAPREQGRFRVVVSHDVDRITGAELTAIAKRLLHATGFRSGAGPSPSLPFSPNAYRDNIRRLLEFERAQGITACYFLLSGPYGLRRHSSRYDARWSQAKKLIGEILGAGMTIGLHGSYYARDSGSYLVEKDRLEQVTGVGVICHRNHYLRFDSRRVCSQLEAAGIRYEFSVGFGERMGFRAGTARLYRMFDLMNGRPASLASVPLVYMDTFTGDPAAASDRDSILGQLRAVLVEAKRVHGCVSLLFHPELLLASPGLWTFFEEVVRVCRDLGADLASPLSDWPAWPSLPGEPSGAAPAAGTRETALAVSVRSGRPKASPKVDRSGEPGPYPEGRSFAFTIIDDTDNATVENTRPVYDLLDSLGMRTTKTVWIYPSRGKFGGESLADPEYRRWALDLKRRGFEIALHGVGSGEFLREEIVEGFRRFEDIFGTYPSLYTNHFENPDNLYWSPKSRVALPVGGVLSFLDALKRLFRRREGSHGGENATSPHFWGDLAKEHIKYVRNLTFNGINTLKYDPRMPYQVPAKEEYSNYWFSSSDGHTLEEFSSLIAPQNVGRLVREQGACIVYTHFASQFVRGGKVDAVFEERLRHLASHRGWFVPAGVLLDHLLARKVDQEDPGYGYLAALGVRWLAHRMIKYLRYRR